MFGGSNTNVGTNVGTDDRRFRPCGAHLHLLYATSKEPVVKEELSGDLHLYNQVVRALFTETLGRVRAGGVVGSARTDDHASSLEHQVKRSKTERRSTSKFLKSNILF